MSYATAKPTLASDIAAFQHKHAFDIHNERILFDTKDETLIEVATSFEVFRFSSQEFGDITFDIRGIKDALAAGTITFQMYDSDLDLKMVEHVRQNNGVEPERIAALTAADLERPAIVVLWPDGHSSVIDGNNRLVRRWDDGLKTLRFAAVKVSPELFPYMCDSGNEEQFLDRESAKRGMTSIAKRRVQTL